MVEYTLCKTYHCLPSQLAREDYDTLMRHMAVQNAISRKQDAEDRAREQASKAKGKMDPKLLIPNYIKAEIIKLEQKIKQLEQADTTP